MGNLFQECGVALGKVKRGSHDDVEGDSVKVCISRERPPISSLGFDGPQIYQQCDLVVDFWRGDLDTPC